MGADHHGYPETGGWIEEHKELNNVRMNEKEKEATMLLRLLDVVAALGQASRSYRPEDQPKSIGQIRSIIATEARKGKLDIDMADEFCQIFLDTNRDTSHVLASIASTAERLNAA